MKIKQTHIKATVCLEIKHHADERTVSALYNGGVYRVTQNQATYDMPQEIVDAVRAAVDWGQV